MEDSYKIQDEFLKIKILFRLFVGLNFLGAFVSYYSEMSSALGTLFHLSFLGVFFFLYNKTFLKLNYSFWTFTFIYLIYFAFKFFNIGGPYEVYLLILDFILLASICYSINSPLYYPRVRWWEYDFRYKGDLKVEVLQGGEVSEGRLYDLRRGAGCITLFKKIDIGSKIVINLLLDGQIYQFHVQAVTAKNNSIGRGFIHGVRFRLTEPDDERKYHRLTRKWRLLVKKRIREKFNESDK